MDKQFSDDILSPLKPKSNNSEDMAEVEAPKKASRKPSAFLYVAAGSALLGAVAMGTVLGWSSPAILSMKENASDPKLEADMKQTEAWIGASTTLGALAGALASGPIAQILGRKIALIIYSVPMVLGFGCLWLAPNMALVIVGRVLAGLSAGLVSGTAPSYVVEISTENVRGMLGTGFQLCVTIGILFVYVFGAFMSWKILSMICIIFPVAMLVMMLLMPETPIWLMTKSGGDFSKGSAVEKALKKLRDESNDNESELKEIAESTAQAQSSKGFSSDDIKNPLFYKPFIISVLLMFFQQFSGINAVMFNAAKMLEDAGSTLEPKTAAILIGVAQVIATLVGTQLVDRLGRKILLIGSGAGHAASLGLLGIYYVAKLDAGWLPVVCLVIFIISFSLGWGPIPWLMIAEITPMEFRSLVSAVATGVNWGCAFLITFNFQWLQDQTSPEFAFFLFALFCVLSIPFVYCFLPETKGKAFDEILRHFTKDEGRPSNKIEMKGLNPKN